MLVRIRARRFQFYCDCPQCGDVDGHGIEQPPTVADQLDITIARFRNTQIGLSNIARDIPQKTYGNIWADETNCDVIRTCNKCGEKWPEE